MHQWTCLFSVAAVWGTFSAIAWSATATSTVLSVGESTLSGPRLHQIVAFGDCPNDNGAVTCPDPPATECNGSCEGEVYNPYNDCMVEAESSCDVDATLYALDECGLNDEDCFNEVYNEAYLECYGIRSEICGIETELYPNQNQKTCNQNGVPYRYVYKDGPGITGTITTIAETSSFMDIPYNEKHCFSRTGCGTYCVHLPPPANFYRCEDGASSDDETPYKQANGDPRDQRNCPLIGG